MIFWLSLVILTASIIFGGGTASGFIGDTIVQLLSVPLIVLSMQRWIIQMKQRSAWKLSDYLLCMVLSGMMLVLISQLVPWFLSDKNGIVNFYPVTVDTLKHALNKWFDFSTENHLRWAAVSSSIPCIAIFFGVATLSTEARLKLLTAICILGSICLCIGFIQIIQGSGSVFRFFEITNYSQSVGFFANRNHFSSQLYITLIFSFMLFEIAISNYSNYLLSIKPLRIALYFSVITSILLGVVIAQSRAGIVLSAIALAGIALKNHKILHFKKQPKLYFIQYCAFISIILSIGLTLSFGLHLVITRFSIDPLTDLRWVLFPTAVDIFPNYLPQGSGLGSFSELYANHEETKHLISGYVNRAHNDWIEFFMETGLFGAIAISLFFIWFTVRIFQITREYKNRKRSNFKLPLEFVIIVIFLVIAHSVVDYPLRTTAISVIFMLSCALLVDIDDFIEENPLNI